MEPPAPPPRARPPQTFLRVGCKKILNRRDLVQKSGLEIGFIFSGMASELRHEPTPTSLPACATCEALISKYGSVSTTGQWKCVFCGKDNFTSDLQSSAWDGAPALRRKVMEHVSSGPLAAVSLPVAMPLSSRMIMFLIDQTVTSKDMEHQASAVCGAMESLSDEVTVGILGFTQVLSLYELPLLARGVLRAQLFSGTRDWHADELSALTRSAHTYIASVGTIRAHLACLKAALIASVGSASSASSSPPPPPLSSARTGRCVGGALSVACAVLAAAAPQASHMMLLTGGAPSLGPGALLLHMQDRSSALSFYRSLALSAAKQLTAIDVFCCGLRRFQVSALQHITEATGGSLVLLPSFSSPLEQSLRAAMPRFIGHHAVLRVHLSHPLRITHLIGPVTGHVPASRSKAEQSCVLHELPLRAVCAEQGLTVICELADDVLASHLYIQASLSYELPSGARLNRVVTQRLPVTGNKAVFMDAVESPTEAVLIAKRLVSAARATPAAPDAMLPDLDARIRQLLALASVNAVSMLPPALVPLPLHLFHLRRGPLLSAVLQHEDDIEALRVLFLHASLPVSLRLLQPQLYVCTPSSPPQQEGEISFIEAPLDDLMLQSDLVLYLDRHTDIFVWIGKSVPRSVIADLQSACMRRASQESGRFPAPQVQVFGEGTSMARWLLCALVPSHKDPREAQVARVPRVAQLDPATYTQLMQKFHHTDDLVRSSSVLSPLTVSSLTTNTVIKYGPQSDLL